MNIHLTVIPQNVSNLYVSESTQYRINKAANVLSQIAQVLKMPPKHM